MRQVQLERVIVDRGSIFTATLYPAATVAEVDRQLEALVKDKHFRFASHNVVAYRLPRCELRLNLMNLLDKRYYDNLIQSDGGRAVPGSGRTAMLSLVWRS